MLWIETGVPLLHEEETETTKEVIGMRMRKKWGKMGAFLIVGLGLTVVVLALGQRESGAQYEQPRFDEEMMKMMHPVELARQFVKDDDLPEQIAEFKWKLFQEYQGKGFTKDEAFQLVLSGGVPFSASE